MYRFISWIFLSHDFHSEFVTHESIILFCAWKGTVHSIAYPKRIFPPRHTASMESNGQESCREGWKSWKSATWPSCSQWLSSSNVALSKCLTPWWPPWPAAPALDLCRSVRGYPPRSPDGPFARAQIQQGLARTRKDIQEVHGNHRSTWFIRDLHDLMSTEVSTE